MDKKIGLELNAYVTIPSSLRDPSSKGAARKEIDVDLAKLYHHYYLDTYGRSPPSPDAAQFEHVRFLMPDADFRFLGNGLGASTSARRSKSAELGQAFCRWFLHDHLGITYFAHSGEAIFPIRLPAATLHCAGQWLLRMAGSCWAEEAAVVHPSKGRRANGHGWAMGKLDQPRG